jgi:hypothetical protein
VAEAAARLGLRPKTLRKQLARGRTPGLKRHGQWFAVLDDVLDAQDIGLDSAGPAAEPVQHADPDVPPVLDSVPDDAGPLVVVVLEAEVAWLRAEVERLHERLAAEQERLREAHVLLAQRPALPAPLDAPTDPSGEPPEASSRPWWAALLWWRR